MKIGLLKYNYDYPTYNLGDYIQSIAVRQYIEGDFILVDREALKSYDGEELKIVLNGWYLHNIEEWPPSDKIHPLFVSFHLTTSAIKILDDYNNVAYFKKFEPIGCRDLYTFDHLRKIGIECVLTGCITLSLVSKLKVSRTDNIIVCDLFEIGMNRPILLRTIVKSFSKGRYFSFLRIVRTYFRNRFRNISEVRKLFSKELLSKFEYRTHFGNIKDSEDMRFEKANTLLRDYGTAKCVITSRLHCALPCIAFNTPVIYIDPFYFDTINDIDKIRVEDYFKYFNLIHKDKGGVSHLNNKVINSPLRMNDINVLEINSITLPYDVLTTVDLIKKHFK